MSVSTGSFRDYRERRIVVGRVGECRIKQLMIKRVTGEGLFFLRKYL